MIDAKQKHSVFSLLLTESWTGQDVTLQHGSAQEENKEQ